MMARETRIEALQSGNWSATTKHLDWRIFPIGGISNCCGATVGNPMDVMKIRLQLDNELADRNHSVRKYNGMARGLRTLVLEEGYTAMWKGWSAAMLREMTFSSLRMGSYEPVKFHLGGTDNANTPIWTKMLAGTITGTTSAMISSPTDLVKIRLQAQASGAQARHAGCLAAFRDIYMSGGIKALWTGCIPNMYRSVAVSCSQVPSYDHTKHTLKNCGLMEEGVPLHMVSATVAAFVSCSVSSPFDIIKTRIMNQPTGGKGNTRYVSPVDALLKTARAEGLLGLYKGFIPAWIRLSPHIVITFMVFEQLRIFAGIAPV